MRPNRPTRTVLAVMQEDPVSNTTNKKELKMKQYQDLLRDILQNGLHKSDRTGVGTRSVFGRHLRFDLGEGFPLVTTKKLHLKSIIYELLWFLRGETNGRYLTET